MTGRPRRAMPERGRWIPCALVILLVSGCTSPSVERHVVYQEVAAGRFVALMTAGETTRKEEQDFIRASERAWHYLRRAMEIEGAQSRREEEAHGKGDTAASKGPVRRRAR